MRSKDCMAECHVSFVHGHEGTSIGIKPADSMTGPSDTSVVFKLVGVDYQKRSRSGLCSKLTAMRLVG